MLCCFATIMRSTIFLVIFVFICGSCIGSPSKRPHIIFILADDLGWNDVSFHGSDEIPTPNIDALAYHGVILKNHYSESLCTPSRSALLTGKYPIHTGTQHNVLLETHPSGLSLDEKLLPEYLKPLGYDTHAVGKWHLGFYKTDYTPTQRGFNSFYGFWNGYQDYFKHNVQASFVPYDGYDMRRNLDVDWSGIGNYSTDLFTNEAVKIIENHNNSNPLFLYLAHLAPHAGTYEDPLQAPEEEIAKLTYITDPDRRRYAAMVTKLDQSVATVVEALQKNSMLNDSVIVFVSDNGAPSTGLMRNYGSNWPLKGEKSTPWEGGIRTVAFIWSPLLQKTRRISRQLIHITDWLPTLYYAAGGNSTELENIDGTNMWPVLTGIKKEDKNYTMLHNIDEELGYGYAALRHGDYKLINGTAMLGFLDDWFGQIQTENIPPYNISEIQRSRTYKIVSQVKECCEKRMLKLREFMTVNCDASNGTIKINSKPCDSKKAPCLFNIALDPCERHNVYGEEDLREIQQDLETKINKFRESKKKITLPKVDSQANPALHNNTWVSWKDHEENLI